MADEVLVAAGRHHWRRIWTDEELLGNIPALPEFPEPIESLRKRTAKVLGKLTTPRNIRKWHPAIGRLLEEDEKRRAKQVAARHSISGDTALFDTAFERRRLGILNTLFLAAARMGCKPSVNDREARSIHFTFHHQHVGIRLARLNRRSHPDSYAQGVAPHDEKLCLSVLQSLGSEEVRVACQDDHTHQLESQLTEIAIQLVLTAEQQYREGSMRQYQWRVEQKAALEKEQSERKLQAERVECERLKQLEQERTDRLLKGAAAFERAVAIRKYVQAIRLAQSSNCACSPEQLERWSQWALAEADRIDPALGHGFLAAMQEDEKAQDTTLSSDE